MIDRARKQVRGHVLYAYSKLHDRSIADKLTCSLRGSIWFLYWYVCWWWDGFKKKKMMINHHTWLPFYVRLCMNESIEWAKRDASCLLYTQINVFSNRYFWSMRWQYFLAGVMILTSMGVDDRNHVSKSLHVYQIVMLAH